MREWQLKAGEPSTSLAQSALETPAPSPRAKVEQRVGVTDFAVEYSSPGVKGRTIWGGLVPFDKVWRTGDNAPTKLTASRDFSLGGKVVPAGSYTVFTIPGSSSWTVILNSDLEAGADEHDPAKDVARLTVTPQTLSSPRERMTFLFSDTIDTGANLDHEWEKVRVRIPLQVDTKAHVRAGIDKAVGEAWRAHFQNETLKKPLHNIVVYKDKNAIRDFKELSGIIIPIELLNYNDLLFN